MSRTLCIIFLLGICCCAVSAQNEEHPVRNVVLVHGSWADGSGWKGGDLSKSTAIKKPSDAFDYLDAAQFREYFAADLSVEQSAFMARSQVLIADANFKAVINTPAWRSKPSWMPLAGKRQDHQP